MNIWKILDIEPTTDIRVIKKAYAAKTKLIHPEEKPEEFRILYEAYQAASWQAKIAKNGEDIPLPLDEKGGTPYILTAPSQEPGETDSQDPKEEELLTYFAKNRELEEKRLAAAADYWKDAWKKYRRPEEKEEFKSYLNSKEFRDIQWHPQVIQLLVEELQQPMYYRYDELWLYLWELYGFREEEIVYQEDVQKLRRILYPAFLRRKEERGMRKAEGVIILLPPAIPNLRLPL